MKILTVFFGSFRFLLSLFLSGSLSFLLLFFFLSRHLHALLLYDGTNVPHQPAQTGNTNNSVHTYHVISYHTE